MKKKTLREIKIHILGSKIAVEVENERCAFQELEERSGQDVSSH